MINQKFNHASVSMGNKIFVIGRAYTTCCEVFDNFSRILSKIYSEISPHLDDWLFNAFSIGNNIVVFQTNPTETVVYLYDVDKEKWINVQCDFTKNMFYTKGF